MRDLGLFHVVGGDGGILERTIAMKTLVGNWNVKSYILCVAGAASNAGPNSTLACR